jgi:hypothetical protein
LEKNHDRGFLAIFDNVLVKFFYRADPDIAQLLADSLHHRVSWKNHPRLYGMTRKTPAPGERHRPNFSGLSFACESTIFHLLKSMTSQAMPAKGKIVLFDFLLHF